MDRRTHAGCDAHAHPQREHLIVIPNLTYLHLVIMHPNHPEIGLNPEEEDIVSQVFDKGNLSVQSPLNAML